MRVTAALAVAALSLLAVPTLALGDGSAAQANTKTFEDATGEDPLGPDISTIVVSNDDGGRLTFRVTIANRPTFTPDMLLLLFLDTTPNAGDKDTLGADYAIQLAPDGGALFRWNGSDFLSDTPQRTFSSEYASGVATFSVSSGELGGARQVKFTVIAISGVIEGADGELDFSKVHRDIAPTRLLGAAGTFTYDVKATLRLAAAGFATSPAKPTAGKTFSVALAATRNDTQALVRRGTVRCTAEVGGRKLTVRRTHVGSGVGTCVFTLPPGSAGATVRGTITLVVDGAQLSRPFSARIS
jgi:hypothetical protein